MLTSAVGVGMKKSRFPFFKSGGNLTPLLGFLFAFPSIVLMVILLFIPMAYSLYLSFIDTSLTKPVPEFIGLKGYFKIFKDQSTWMIFKNSLIWTLAVAVLQSVVGLITAVLLNRPFYGRWMVRGITVLPWVIPGVVAAMVWRLVYDAQLGFLNNMLFKLGLLKDYIDWLGTPRLAMYSVIFAAVWKGFGFSMLMYLAALQGIPSQLYEASNIDGANKFQQFLFITIPGISSVMRTTLLLTSIWTFNYFEIIYVMTGGGPIRATHIAPTYIYEVAFRNFNMGDASRFSVISFILVGIISLVYIREIKKRESF